MILRFVSKEGQFRLTVEPTTTFPEVLPQLAEKLPKTVDLDSITVSNRPQGGDARKIIQLKGVSFNQVGLSCVTWPHRLSKLTPLLAVTAHSYFSPLRSGIHQQTAATQRSLALLA